MIVRPITYETLSWRRIQKTQVSPLNFRASSSFMNSSSAQPSPSEQFLQGFCELVQAQVEAACSDLTQTDNLLDEAIEQLNTCFNALGEGLEQHEAARMPADSPSLRPHVHLAITSLQFHDLTRQLLQRVRLRLEGLQTAATTGLSLDATRPDWTQALEVLAAQQSQLGKTLQGELHQQDLSCGDIELF